MKRADKEKRKGWIKLKIMLARKRKLNLYLLQKKEKSHS
jgi:hypothetical protein